MNRPTLALRVIVCWGLFCALSVLRQFQASIRFLASASYYEGILKHLHGSKRLTATSPARAPDMPEAIQ